MAASNTAAYPRHRGDFYWKNVVQAFRSLLAALLSFPPARQTTVSAESDADIQIRQASMRLAYLKAAG
jgi:hypothetical protein